ncbi:hypothetical protein CCP4SC76_5180031 [Gammaproteobacteria bacterium]
MKKRQIVLATMAAMSGLTGYLVMGDQEAGREVASLAPIPINQALVRQAIVSHTKEVQLSHAGSVSDQQTFSPLEVTGHSGSLALNPELFQNRRDPSVGPLVSIRPTGDIKVVLNDGEQARDFILNNGRQSLGLTGYDSLASTSSKTDDMGNHYYKYQQTYQDIPVFGREVVVNTGKDSRLLAVLGEIEPNIQLDIKPALKKSEVLSAARGLIGETLTQEPVMIQEPALVIYAGNELPPVLAYHTIVEFTSVESGYQKDEVFVDAKNGSLVARVPTLHAALTRSIHTRNDQCASSSVGLPGALVSDPANGTDQHAKDAFNNTGSTYWFFKHMFGRDSFDAQGAELKSTVHVKFQDQTGCSGDNLLFDSSSNLLLIGSGGALMQNPAGALDLVGHELTHGITHSESNLSYQGESGAINESLSDIFGAAVQTWVASGGSETGNPANGLVPNANTWVMGEDTALSEDRLRYMNDPSKDGQSRDNYLERSTATSDHGGVHSNSGIMNLAFYLMSQGGTHPRSSVSANGVTAMGFEKALRVMYDANVGLFTTGTTFQGAREKISQAASNRYGQCSAEWRTVHQAFDAVKVPGTWTDCASTGTSGNVALPATATNPVAESAPASPSVRPVYTLLQNDNVYAAAANSMCSSGIANMMSGMGLTMFNFFSSMPFIGMMMNSAAGEFFNQVLNSESLTLEMISCAKGNPSMIQAMIEVISGNPGLLSKMAGIMKISTAFTEAFTDLALTNTSLAKFFFAVINKELYSAMTVSMVNSAPATRNVAKLMKTYAKDQMKPTTAFAKLFFNLGTVADDCDGNEASNERFFFSVFSDIEAANTFLATLGSLGVDQQKALTDFVFLATVTSSAGSSANLREQYLFNYAMIKAIMKGIVPNISQTDPKAPANALFGQMLPMLMNTTSSPPMPTAYGMAFFKALMMAVGAKDEAATGLMTFMGQMLGQMGIDMNAMAGMITLDTGMPVPRDFTKADLCGSSTGGGGGGTTNTTNLLKGSYVTVSANSGGAVNMVDGSLTTSWQGTASSSSMPVTVTVRPAQPQKLTTIKVNLTYPTTVKLTVNGSSETKTSAGNNSYVTFTGPSTSMSSIQIQLTGRTSYGVNEIEGY